MKALFLSPHVPRPALHAGHDRILGLLRCLSRFARVEVLAVGSEQGDERDARDFLSGLGISLKVFAPTGPGPSSRGPELAWMPESMRQLASVPLREALEARMLKDPPDVTHFETLAMAQYVDSTWTARVLHRHSVELLHHERMAARPTARAAFHRLEAARLRRWEVAVAGRFERVLVAEESTARALSPFAGVERTRVVPILIGDSIRRPDAVPAAFDHVLLHAGDGPGGREALDAYFREVWPALCGASALRTVVMVSGRAPAGVARRADRVIAFRDRGAELFRTGVLLIPPRHGLADTDLAREALAAGMPVVSTQAGVQGLGLEPGRHYLRAETAAETVGALLRLAREPALVTELSRNGAWWVDPAVREGVVAAAIEAVFRGALRSCSLRRRLPRRVAFLCRACPPRVEPWLRSRLPRESLRFKALRALKRAVVAATGRLRVRASRRAAGRR